MKMQKNADLLAAILAAKVRHRSNPYVYNGITFAADIMAVRLQSNQPVMCAIVASGSFGVTLNAGLVAISLICPGVFIGYISTARLVRLSNASLLKKPGRRW